MVMFVCGCVFMCMHVVVRFCVPVCVCVCMWGWSVDLGCVYAVPHASLHSPGTESFPSMALSAHRKYLPQVNITPQPPPTSTGSNASKHTRCYSFCPSGTSPLVFLKPNLSTNHRSQMARMSLGDHQINKKNLK